MASLRALSPREILSPNALLAGIAVALALVVLNVRRKRNMPPGPRGLPIIGNVFDMPTEKSWETFSEWGEKYGPICSVTVLGQPIVIINKLETAIELLERKSGNYSERPRLVMGGELVGYNKTTPLLPYGPAHRTSRSHFSKLIGSNDALKRFKTIQEEESHRFLRRMLDNPQDLRQCLRQTAGSLILRITYGIKVQDPVDPYITLIDEATTQFSELISPGAFLVDVLPFLKHVPEWLGATFKSKAKVYKASFDDMLDKPYDFTRDEVKAGTAPPSFTAAILEDSKTITEEEIYAIKCTASSLYAGAADTTVSVLYGFFLAMCMYPEVQSAAQEEIDRVIGNDRLPTLSDRPQLPYINALVKETFRFHTVGPTGVPHCVKNDDVYGNYLIPAGTIVFANLWKMANDPESYHNPEKFDPNRHISSPGKPAERDPSPFTFGFGRRRCPGSWLAEQSVYLETVMALATFSITAKTKNGKPVKLSHEYLNGAISHPADFEYDLKPRSEKAQKLILQQFDN